MDTSLTPTDLFSPSKARQQRAQAQDWASVNSWLETRYAGRPVPPFERNEDTLKALLALAAANERADEERDLVERVEREALKEMEERAREQDLQDSNAHILATLTEHLAPPTLTTLHSLASSSTILNTPDTHPTTLAHAIHPLTTRSADLAQESAHITTLQSHLAAHHARLSAELDSLRTNPAFQAPGNITQQTQSLVAQTKQLRAKIGEYTSRLAALGPAGGARGGQVPPGDPTSAASMAALEKLEQEIEGLVEGAEGLERQVDAYKGLPANKEAARRELRALEREVEGLRQRRDGMFEGMV